MISKLATKIALGGAIALSFLPAVAFAYPPVAYERIYYAEPEHTTEVGGMYRPCLGQGITQIWGTSSAFYTETTYPCE